VLSGHRVLDLSDERGFLAGRILADLGADVIKIEPPGGDPERARGPFVAGVPGPERGLPWLAANPGKRSLVLDLAGNETDRERFRALASGADVVLETYAPGTLEGWGLGYGRLVEGLPDGHPGLVLCSITPFGQTGPYAHYAAHDLVAVAMGGNAFMTGDPERPPLRCSLPTSYMHAGPEAVVGITMALYGREQLGRGQRVDVSLQECQLATLITGAGQYALTGRGGRRGGYRTGRTREIWRCKDGYISYGLRGGAARAGSLAATVEYMAESEMAPDFLREMEWASYNPLSLSDEELERLESAFAAFFAIKSMRELYEQALARRILLAPCNNAREILEQPQLRSRDFFERIELPGLGTALEYPAFFARTERGRIGVRGPAPELDSAAGDIERELSAGGWQAQASAGCEGIALRTEIGPGGLFEGLRVLELGSGAAGPVATRYLAEQGATVVRIESSRRPDFLRMLHVTRDNRNEPDILEHAPMFVLLNPNKRSVALNMKEPEAIEIVRQLVAWSDVVAENFAPGVMEKWGLGREALRAIKPQGVMVSGCLFGQTGPQRSYPGFGGQGAAIAGFNHMTGWPGGEALGPYATITDSLAPRFVAAAVVSALIDLRRSGRGQYIDVSQIETGVYGLSEMIVRYSANAEVMSRLANRCEYAAPHGIYPALGEAGAEAWIAIAVFDDAQWQALLAVMGDAGARVRDARFATAEGRMEHVEELEAALAEWTALQPPRELMERLQAAGVEAGVVQGMADLLEDPQLAERSHFLPIDHEPLGGLLFERSGFRLSETPGRLDRPGPRLGEHQQEVLGGILGMSAGEMEDLERREIAV
jgi:crotonobetainyl-CoA:carnitine CoA-transferase CaiB-like acyl-CoA transferase